MEFLTIIRIHNSARRVSLSWVKINTLPLRRNKIKHLPQVQSLNHHNLLEWEAMLVLEASLLFLLVMFQQAPPSILPQ